MTIWIDYRVQRRFCGGITEIDTSKRGHKNVESTSYGILLQIFEDPRVMVTAEDIIVDIGCGSGRVLNFLISRRMRNYMIGIEYQAEVAAITKRKLSRYNNVKIVTGDILNEIPLDGTLFYMYNPFDNRVMAKLIPHFKQLPDHRKVRIVYLNPACVDLFLSDGDFNVEYGRVGQVSRKYAIITLQPSMRYKF